MVKFCEYLKKVNPSTAGKYQDLKNICEKIDELMNTEEIIEVRKAKKINRGIYQPYQKIRNLTDFDKINKLKSFDKAGEKYHFKLQEEDDLVEKYPNIVEFGKDKSIIKPRYEQFISVNRRLPR